MRRSAAKCVLVGPGSARFVRGRDDPSSLAAGQHVHQLGHLLALLAGIAAGDGVLDAMGDVVAQDLLLDHAGKSTHLALDAAQALAAR